MEAGKLTGYVTRYRFVKITSKMVLQFSTLAGYGAKLYVANKNNSFVQICSNQFAITLPVDQTQADKSYSYKNETGTRMVGAFRFVPDTPWLVALEFHTVLLFRDHQVPLLVACIGNNIDYLWDNSLDN